MGRTDFFPPPPDDLSRLRRICIGTKSRSLGDALMLSSLPRRLKERYPGLEIRVFPRAFNPYVFSGNPHVDGIAIFPDRLYGDDANRGAGHLIQLKEQFFGLEPSSSPRPELHLTRAEGDWIDRFIRERGQSDRPICVIHPWGSTVKAAAPRDFWIELVRRGAGRFRFWQVGLEGHEAIPGCEFHFFRSPRRSECRRIFSLMSRAAAFVGVDSGPMHVAAAFGVRSLIVLQSGRSQEIFDRRRVQPYFLHQNYRHAFLYERNEHLDAEHLSPAEMSDRAGGFLTAGG